MMSMFPGVLRKPDDQDEPQPVESDMLSAPTLSSDVTACLGHRLRAYYSHLMKDPIPEAFIQILEPMDRKRSANH